MLAWSLVAFERSALTDSVVIVTGRSDVGLVRRLVFRLRLKKVGAVVPGGARRADSVRSGLALLPGRGYVAIHDAARPLLTARMIDDGFRICRGRGPAAYAAPLCDTVKRAKRGRIFSTVPRDELCAAQTPQFFPLPLVRRGHEEALRRGLAPTDDCAAVELVGSRPLVIPSLLPNFKVTTPADMKLAEAVLRSGPRRHVAITGKR